MSLNFFKHIPRHDKLDGGGGIVIYLFIYFTNVSFTNSKEEMLKVPISTFIILCSG